jgi:hypothetical protein
MFMVYSRDHSLDTLLSLNGEQFEIRDGYWVKFIINRTEVSKAKPHGLDYSLSLHGPDNHRIIGFDNAHAISKGTGPGKKVRVQYDHKHKLTGVDFYDYEDAATLLGHFWEAVEEFLKEYCDD